MVNFVCPDCNTSSRKMMPLREKYKMSKAEAEIARKTEPIFEFIGHEILWCPNCEERITWFEMKRLER